MTARRPDARAGLHIGSRGLTITRGSATPPSQPLLACRLHQAPRHLAGGGTASEEAAEATAGAGSSGYLTLRDRLSASRGAQRDAVTQFLDIGAGMPTRDNTQKVAQRIDPRSRVVYVDGDPVVMAHARALLTSGPEGSCGYVHSDLRDTEYILGHASRTLDLAQPVGVLLLAVLHLIPDADDPAGVVAALASGLAPGSGVAISHLTAGFAPEAVSDAVDAYNKVVPTPVMARTHAEVTGLFAGLPPVAPGVVPVSEWRPDAIVRQVVDLYGGIARINRRRR